MEIYNLVRASTAPYPMAKTYYKNNIVFISKLIPFNFFKFKNIKEGTIIEKFYDDSLLVKTLDGDVLIKNI